MRVLLLGARGQLGVELAPLLARWGDVTAWRRDQLDLSDVAQVRRQIEAFAPDLLVNAAAYTAVDRAESEADLALRVNGDAVREMAQAMAECGGAMLHYSTDYVFDGTASRPWREEDAVAPLNRYGDSKLAGENFLREALADHLILRTSWLYSHHGTNFLRTILRLTKEREELRIVSDQVGAPTWARHVAQVTCQVLERWLAVPDRSRDAGVYHLSAAGEVSWCGFAEEILRLKHGGELPPRPRLCPITTSEYPTPARRPTYSVLSNAKLRRVFGIQPVQWRASLRECMSLLCD